MATRVEVKGLRELGEAMRGLSSDVNKRIARAATAAGAVVVKKAAQAKAPVLTGNLRRNVIVKRIPPGQTSLTSEHIVTVRRGKITEKQKAKGLKDAFYASFVEHGTVNAPAQPFLRPAFEQSKMQAVAAIKDRLAKRIEKAQRGGK